MVPTPDKLLLVWNHNINPVDKCSTQSGEQQGIIACALAFTLFEWSFLSKTYIYTDSKFPYSTEAKILYSVTSSCVLAAHRCLWFLQGREFRGTSKSETTYRSWTKAAFNFLNMFYITMIDCEERTLLTGSTVTNDWFAFQYVDEEELMNAIKGFSSVTKEHTTFTDTHL